MNSVDLMGIAIEWLDCYQAGDVYIVDLYAEDASLQCACEGRKELRGKGAIAAYWHQRLVEKPAGELIDLQGNGSDIVLDFRVAGSVVEAVLTFDADGSLVHSRCGPWNNKLAGLTA